MTWPCVLNTNFALHNVSEIHSIYNSSTQLLVPQISKKFILTEHLQTISCMHFALSHSPGSSHIECQSTSPMNTNCKSHKLHPDCRRLFWFLAWSSLCPLDARQIPSQSSPMLSPCPSKGPCLQRRHLHALCFEIRVNNQVVSLILQGIQQL